MTHKKIVELQKLPSQHVYSHMWLMECVHEILVNYITELHHCLTLPLNSQVSIPIKERRDSKRPQANGLARMSVVIFSLGQ